MKIKSLFLLAGLFSSLLLVSQEALRPLSGNLNYHYSGLNGALKTESPSHQQKQMAGGLEIPFKEDFYYACTQQYPDQALWADSLVYVNTGFPIAPPSIGVATFDGLNKHGYPYMPTLLNMNLSYPADTLTSAPINLQVISSISYTLSPIDSVGMIFYIQARGYGDNPESGDSLLLDFYKPKQNTWTHNVWFQRGNLNSNVNDSVFKKIFVRIEDTAYFHEGFRFRFRNMATPVGNFDHWHLDYIHLSRGIFKNSDPFDDLAITQIPSPLLKEYSAMPYQHYMSSEMASKISVRIRNNRVGPPITMSYEHKVYTAGTNSLVHSYLGGPVNLPSFATAGYSSLQVHSQPTLQYSFAENMTDSTDYIIKHYLFRSGSSQGSEYNVPNDTVTQYQRFRNYFALDDGSAEQSYYVNAPGARIAVKVKLNAYDTLHSLRVYFDPAGNINAAKTRSFQIIVYNGDNFGPMSVKLLDPVKQGVKFFDKGFKGVPEYKLQTPLVLEPGTYYIGVQQQADALQIGFDRNYNFSRNTYFYASTSWQQSQIAGSVMMRPVFGKRVPPPVGLNDLEMEAAQFDLYPNPASNSFIIRGAAYEGTTFELHNAMGQKLNEGALTATETEVSTNQLANGLYVLVIRNKGMVLCQKKLIIRN